jgi:type IV pilus assembly protein PilW
MATLTVKPATPHASRGLSLIEILVGLVIGMIGIVVIFQVLAVSEDRKRTTVQGSDSQSAGSIALYSLQRDVQHGGYGFGGADTKEIGCLVSAYNSARATQNFTFRLYPIEIVQGAAGAPDAIRVLWGNANYAVNRRAWTAGGGSSSAGVPMKRVVGGRGGLDYGDLVILTSDPALAAVTTDCALIQVTDRPTASPQEMGFDSDYTFNPGPPADTLGYGATAAPQFNKPGGLPALLPPFAAAAGFVFNLGNQPRQTVWSIAGNRLVVSENLFGPPAIPDVEAADGIVNLQAEYGIDRNNNQLIEANEWTETAPNNALVPSDLANPCGDNPSRSWRCVRAIRVALLARSSQWDRTFCSPNPQWTAGASGALVRTNFVMTNVDGAADTFAGCAETPPDPNNWRRYRYSVYETLIPLRNMIWGTAP